MAEFKNQAEYEKWKAEKAKRAKEVEIEKPSKQDSTLTLSKNMVIIMAVILVLITATIVYFKVNDKVGKISGNIFARMKSGDVKRAAGIEVYLIKDDNTIFPALQNMKETCKNKVDPILYNKDYHSGYGGEEDYKRKQHLDQIFAVCYAKMTELILGNTVQKTRTDVNGFYEFSNVPFGMNLFVFSQYEVFNDKLEWLEPINLNTKEVKLDLTNSNEHRVTIF